MTGTPHTFADWMALFGPTLLLLSAPIGAALVAAWKGWFAKGQAYLQTHHMANVAAALADANAVIQPAITTGASAIIANIANGSLDVTKRADLIAAAQHEEALILSRVPQAIAIAQPVAGALVAAMLSKVDSHPVATGATASDPVTAVTDAVSLLAAVDAARSAGPAPVPANDTAPAHVSPLIVTP